MFTRSFSSTKIHTLYALTKNLKHIFDSHSTIVFDRNAYIHKYSPNTFKHIDNTKTLTHTIANICIKTSCYRFVEALGLQQKCCKIIIEILTTAFTNNKTTD